MGTSFLGLIGGIFVFCFASTQRLRQFGGWREMLSHWRDVLKDGAFAAILFWAAVFSYQLLYKIPQDINRTASVVPLPKQADLPTLPQMAFDLVGKWKILRAPNPTAPSSPTPTLTTAPPDPYLGQPDSEVANWALQEAESLKNFGDRCEQESVAARNDPSGLAMVQLKAWQDFNEHHKDVVTKLHDSLSYRLGPVATKAEQVSYRDLLSSEDAAINSPSHFTYAVCMSVQMYSSNLASLARLLSGDR